MNIGKLLSERNPLQRSTTFGATGRVPYKPPPREPPLYTLLAYGVRSSERQPRVVVVALPPVQTHFDSVRSELGTLCRIRIMKLSPSLFDV